MSADLHQRLDTLKTTMVRAYAARDADALRAAVAESWVLSRALTRETDVNAVYDLIGITVTEGSDGGPVFTGESPGEEAMPPPEASETRPTEA
jgi:hypothetical protein